MSVTTPESGLVVNHMPHLASAVQGLIDQLSSVLESPALSPADFAEAEKSLLRAVAEVGKASVTELLEHQAASTPMLDYQGRTYIRLEPTRLKYLSPYGRSHATRSLYRELGVRNGSTIDPVAIRAGLLDSMTPAAAKLCGGLQAVTVSREAQTLVEMFGIKLSRSAIERGSAALAEQLERHREPLEEALISEFELPEDALTLAVSVDRVTMPFEEPRTRPKGRPRNGAPKRPVKVVYHETYCACWTLYDEEAKPLYACRYGRAPANKSAGLIIEEQLRFDVLKLLEHRPSLQVVTLSDGAAEMWQMLERVVKGIEGVVALVDYWHVIGYVSTALSHLGRSDELGRVKRSLLESQRGARKWVMKLETWASEEFGAGPMPEALHDALRYLRNRLEKGHLAYAGPRQRKLPIGSGHVEATCKMVVSVRMKRPGSRWKMQGAQHVLTLRSLVTSSRWDGANDWLIKHRDSHTSAIRELA